MRRTMTAALMTGYLTSALGCASQAADPTATAGQALTACPAHTTQDNLLRASATVAFNLMKLAANQVPANDTQTSILPNVQSTSILAPQRYRVQPGGTGIEFDPNDPLYSTYVSNAMKAQLAFAQTDSTVAAFLSEGLNAAYAQDNGHYYPHILALPALGPFSFQGPVTTHIRDSSSQDNSHYATVSSQAWCDSVVVTIAETVDESFQFAPLYMDNINMWTNTVPSYFHGSQSSGMTPFNGPSGANPYLIVAVDGQPEPFASVPYVNCWNNAGYRCTSTIQIDPAPYAEPGSYYNGSGLVGTQANPFVIVGTLYATPDHAGQWATRTVNNAQQWGQFSTPVTMFGTTLYQFTQH